MKAEGYRNYISKENHENDRITIIAKGLTQDEERKIRELIKAIERKRSHEKRSWLLHDLIFRS